MKVGIITRKGERRDDIRMFSKFFDVIVYELPKDIPIMVENPSEYLQLPDDFKPDMVISYARHPDINLELIKIASERGIGLVIISGGAESGSYIQLKREGEKRGVKVLWDEICCAIPDIKDDRYSEFFKHFGSPEVEVEIENGKIKDVRIIRSAFCGATYFVAEKIKGLSLDEAPTKAGYYTQIYPCMAKRGIDGGIHKAARAHKRAVEKAIEKALKKSTTNR